MNVVSKSTMNHRLTFGEYMALLMFPILVFAYYKQKYTLRNWLMFIAIIGSIVGVLGAGKAFGIVLVAQIVGIPIVFLSARFTAWCIKRYVNRKKTNYPTTKGTTMNR